jgi:hypothetical protein
VTRETAEARAGPTNVAAGDDAPLLGIPTSCRCPDDARHPHRPAQILEFVPLEDGTITRRLAEAGTVLPAKPTWTSSRWAVDRELSLLADGNP